MAPPQLSQASRYPELRILLACRSFDLDHDPSLLERVSGKSPTALRIDVEKLSSEDVDAVLAVAGIADPDLAESQVELLRTPLHLYLFLGGGVDRDGFGSRRDLFGRYWDEKAEASRRGSPRLEHSRLPSPVSRTS